MVTGGLLGPPWSTFWFLQIGRDFRMYFVKGFCQKKIKKSKKSNHLIMPFFIKNWQVSAYLAVMVLKHSNRLHKADWLGWFCVMYRNNTGFHCTIPCVLRKIESALNFLNWRRCLSGAPLFSHKNKSCLMYYVLFFPAKILLCDKICFGPYH